MKKEMKVLIANGNSRAEIVSMPLPSITENTVLVKVYYCGICGTDQDLFSGQCSFVENGQVSYPLRLGHEWSGIVEQVGANVVNFKPGDYVVGDNAITCGVCESCQKGDYTHCHHMLNVGTINPVYDGAFCEYYLIPEHHLHKIPSGISLKEASLAEPLSVAYGGIKRMNITEASTVAVIGSGCIGMSAVVLAKCLGAKQVFMIARNKAKLETAKRLGAIPINISEDDAAEMINKMTNGKGADFVLECSGAKGTFSQAIRLAAFKGVVSLIGFYEYKEIDVDIDSIVSKALHLFGVMGEMDNMSGALTMLEKYKPDLLPIITDELIFDDCIGGFTRKNHPNSVKILVKINEVIENE